MSKFFSKNSSVFLILVFVAIFAFYPVFNAQAQTILERASNLWGGIGRTLANNTIVPVFNGLRWLSLDVMENFLNIIVGWTDDFIGKSLGGLSDTDPSKNKTIGAGWTVLRDLVNILFIIGLAYIGLTTALGKEGFDTKKTFGKLIITALIINFSPVICGVIVDVANIVMNFFLSSYNFQPVIGVFAKVRQSIDWNSVSGAEVVRTVILMVYSFFASIVMILISIYFLTRHILIWLCVILSPLAFFSSIFKETEKFYAFWKKTFLMAAFTGVPIGFIVYLSTIMITVL